tara:strand:+ start:3792 stop:4748 length:957 start_codon:yes stop_codon:yes gene_type:complete
MSIQFLDSGSANGYAIRNDEYNFLFRVAKIFQNKHPNKKICFMRESWLTQELAENMLKNINYDFLITFCLMDEHVIDTNKFNNAISVGYIKNSKYFYDSLAVLFAKHFNYNIDINTNPKLFQKSFLSYNGKPHEHRKELIKSLRKAELVDKGYISFASMETIALRKIKQDDILKNRIVPGPYDPLTFGPMENWNTFFLNIVTETSPNPSDSWFWNEKTFKPMLGYRPFLTYAPGGNVEMLKHYKFEDYVNDFNDISDLDLTNTDNIVPFLKVLSEQNTKYIVHKYKQLWEKITYNRQHFFDHVKNQSQIFSRLEEIAI